jgi:hypothetical protein
MTPEPTADRLRDPNPYDVLQLSGNPTTAEISRSFMAAMKRRDYSAEVIARSRKRLLDPQERLLANYLRLEFPEEEPLPISRTEAEVIEAVIEPEIKPEIEPEIKPAVVAPCPEHLDGLLELLHPNEEGVLGFDRLLGSQNFEP